jgi:hypothetical protein
MKFSLSGAGYLLHKYLGFVSFFFRLGNTPDIAAGN